MIVSAHDEELVTYLLDQRYIRRVLVEGDSWASIGGYFNGNLIMALDDMFEDSVLFVNCAVPGDHIRYMAAIAGHSTVGQNLRLFNSWDMLFLSGGGNDLMARMRGYVGASGIDYKAFGTVLLEIRQGFEEFIALRRRHRPSMPIVCHNYDRPRLDPTRRFLQPGPWIASVFQEVGLPKEDWPVVMQIIMAGLNDLLLDLSRDHAGFYVINTFGTLKQTRAGWFRSGDWENEIHPSATGYRALAAKCVPVLSPILEGET